MLMTQRACLASLLFLMACLGPVSGSEVEDEVARRLTARQIPLERIQESLRPHVDEVLTKANLFLRGPTEAFPCRPGVYRWLLDHPEWSIAGWKALANTPISIDRQADGSFLGKDNYGGSLRWQCILSEPGRRVWYAEGSGRMAPFLPVMTLKAVLCLKYQEVRGDDGRVGIRHRAECFALYDQKTASWFNLLASLSPEATGKKVLEQIEIFFSGMAYYMSENPEWTTKNLATLANTQEGEKKLGQLRQELTTRINDRPSPYVSRP